MFAVPSLQIQYLTLHLIKPTLPPFLTCKVRNRVGLIGIIKMENKSQLEIINLEIAREIASADVRKALLQTTFKGLSEIAMRQAMFEGMMRGYTFKDFLEKNVYAIPFKGGYSLITSIDRARKIGMRSGVVGSSEPIFEEKDKKIGSCSITIKRKVADYIGDYSAKVYFDEYFKEGKNGYPSLWERKPHTMIAKVAEMHALRKACPEELAQEYIEEEMQREATVVVQEVNMSDWETKLRGCKKIEEIKSVWASMPQQAKGKLKGLKDELKVGLEK